jgi:hypothetical protein
MDRAQLAQMLDHEGEAFAACRQAVLADGRIRIYDGTQPASTLLRPPYHYQLFLDETGTAVIACLGVDQSHQRWAARGHMR